MGTKLRLAVGGVSNQKEMGVKGSSRMMTPGRLGRQPGDSEGSICEFSGETRHHASNFRGTKKRGPVDVRQKGSLSAEKPLGFSRERWKGREGKRGTLEGSGGKMANVLKGWGGRSRRRYRPSNCCSKEKNDGRKLLERQRLSSSECWVPWAVAHKGNNARGDLSKIQ